MSYPSTKWTLFVCLLLIFIRWVQGLKKFQFGFLGDHILCIKCGPSIKFHDILTNKVETLHLPTKYSTVLSIHPLEPYFAVTELCNVNPNVYVYSYPQKDEIILKSKLQPDSQALSILIKQMLPNWRYNSPSFPIPSIMQQFLAYLILFYLYGELNYWHKSVFWILCLFQLSGLTPFVIVRVSSSDYLSQKLLAVLPSFKFRITVI